jgi:hypothetical protein
MKLFKNHLAHSTGKIIIALLICIVATTRIHAASKVDAINTQKMALTKVDATNSKVTQKNTDVSVPPIKTNAENKFNTPTKRKKHYPFGVKFVTARPPQYVFLVPAHFGGTVFTAVSCFVGWPFSAAWNYSHGKTTRRDLTPPVPWASRTFGVAGAYLVGGPFWCLEQAFWEFPVWLFSDEKPEEPKKPRNLNGYRIGTGI